MTGGLVALSACGAPGNPPENSPEQTPPVSEFPDTIRSITDVVRLRAAEIMALPGVVGIGEGRLPDGRTCVRIFLAHEDPELRARLPRTLDGYPVDVEVTGEIRAMPEDSAGSTP